MRPDASTDPVDSGQGVVPSPERAAQVGKRLRQIFDEAVAEPIPDAFKDLLRKLG